MADATRYTPAEEPDLPEVCRLVSLAFGGDLASCDKWLRMLGVEHLRLIRDRAGRPLASLARIPMGQFFGGRSVPMVGIAGVAVAPEARGGGLALNLMRHAVREIAAEGVALSCLYASTQTLYRQVGFEQAGYRFRVRLPLARVGVRERGLPVRSLTPQDDPAVRDCYRAFASAFDGMLDRGPYCWARVRELRGEAYQGFGIPGSDGRVEGYLFLCQRRKPESGRFDLMISDLAFTTPDAGRRLAGFLSDMATIGDDAVFCGGAWHPLLGLLPQRTWTVDLLDYWMLRVTDVAAAVTARGYPTGGPPPGEFGVADPLIETNSGRWRVSRDGIVKMEKAGMPSGDLAPVGAFASMYSGLVNGRSCGLAGFCESGQTTAGWLESAFGPSTPAMVDMF